MTDIQKSVDTLIYLYDLSTLGATKIELPESVKELRITQELLNKHATTITERTSTATWFMCFTAFKKENPEKTVEDFRDAFSKPAGLETFKKTLELVAVKLNKDVTSKQLRDFVKSKEVEEVVD
jgi:hypothetical protein